MLFIYSVLALASMGGFEPPTGAVETRCSSPLSYIEKYGGECGIRTHGPDEGPTVFKTIAFDHSANSPF